MGLFGSLFDKAGKQMQELGLRQATLEEKYGRNLPLKNHVESLVETGRLREFEAIFQQAWSSGELGADGRRLYTSVLRWVVALDERTIANPVPFLSAFATEFERTPTPFWGGLLATALQAIGDEERGGEWAHQVTQAQWARHDTLHAQAATVLSASRDGADASYPWLESAYLHALTGADQQTFNSLWERLYGLDRLNFAVLETRGIHLLPRWRGAGPGDAERFARQAVEASRDALGTGAYAAVYSAYPNIGELPIEDTEADPELLRQSTQDLLARFPGSIVLQNEAANIRSWADDEAGVWSVYEGGLRAVEPFSWGGDDEDEGMEYATKAFVYARDNR